jgi:predicted nucleic acid-binding protein
MHVYLETTVFCWIFDAALTAEIASDLLEILAKPDLKFVTSRKALDEVRKTPDPIKRLRLECSVALVEKKTSQVGFPSPQVYGGMLYGGFLWQSSPLLCQLQNVFDPADAEHVFHAIRAKCRYFLTLDKKTILKRVRRKPSVLKPLCGDLEFCSPAEMVARLRAPAS